MLVVADIEADSLNPKRLWVIVTKELKSGLVRVFREPDLHPEEFREYAARVTGWIGHNFLGFDGPVINRLVPGVRIDPGRIIDTLVVSRTVDFKADGGHSLKAWGHRLGFPKDEFPSEWFATFLEHWDEGLKYCKQDVEVTYQLYKKLEKFINSPMWKYALRLEHDMELMCRELHENGFAFDHPKATDLMGRLDEELQQLEQGFQRDFAPRYKAVREITPVLTKSGKLHSKDFRWLTNPEEIAFYDVACPFTLVERVEFDPASKQQIIDRLWEAGWKPVVKTEGHKDFLKATRRRKKLDPDDQAKKTKFDRYGWKVDDTNLATLPPGAPDGAKRLTRWLHLTGRKNQLQGWLNAYNPDTHRIHARFFHIGSWTHRMSHAEPNMANATAEHEYRELWTADPYTVLVGCDAEGIQLRILAHYINDPVFTTALISGDKKLGTDAHSLNARALGEVCLRHGKQARDRAKTFIYAFVLGATPPKIAEIFECHPLQAEEAVDRFIEAYPGLRTLKEDVIPGDARRGYFEGFDGRYVKCDSEHLMLAGYLQNGEQAIMKTARRIWNSNLQKRNIWFKHVNLVHDEFQTVCLGLDAHTVGRAQAAAIKEAGEILKVRAPMAGEYKIGLNWSQTH